MRSVFSKAVGVLILAGSFWALPSTASAASICAAVPGTDVTTYNAGGGCTIDGLLFSNFAVFNAANTPTPLVNAVFAEVINGTVYFTFNPNLSLGTLQDIYFLFNVSTLDGSASISGVDLEVVGDNASISESLCTVSWLPGISCIGNGGTLIGGGLVAGVGPGYSSFDQDFFTPVSSAWVFKDIAHQPGGHLTAFRQSFHVPDGGSAMTLLGLGLLALGSIRRRFGRH